MADNRSTSIALLGCSGFIGSHLLERILYTTGYTVEGIDRTTAKINHLIGHSRLHFHQSDIHDAAIRQILERCGTVVSLAALCNPWLYTHNAVEVIESNFVGMYPIVKMCSDLGCRLIHFSTSEVYGRTLGGYLNGAVLPAGRGPGQALIEDATPLLLGPVSAQRWCYASAKQLLERTIFAYGVEHGLDYTIVRPFNFIGPRMDFISGIDGEGVPRVLACFMEALMRGTPLRLVDGGLNRRCFTAIGDAVDAVMLIIGNREASQQRIFNIGNPANETTVAELASRMIVLYRELCPKPSAANPSVDVVSGYEFYGAGYEDSDRRVPDIGAISAALGWHPATGLDEALRIAMDGFLTEYTNKINNRT